MSINPNEKPESPNVTEVEAKKPYETPRLMIHGTVDRITEALRIPDATKISPESRILRTGRDDAECIIILHTDLVFDVQSLSRI